MMITHANIKQIQKVKQLIDGNHLQCLLDHRWLGKVKRYTNNEGNRGIRDHEFSSCILSRPFVVGRARGGMWWQRRSATTNRAFSIQTAIFFT